MDGVSRGGFRIFRSLRRRSEVVDLNQTHVIGNAVRAAASLISHVSVNGDGSMRREFTHVIDVAEAIRLALEFVGPMIAADARSPLERVRSKLEETFGEFELALAHLRVPEMA